MIRITITKVVTESGTKKENVITKKTPTDNKDRYESVVFAEEYAVAEVGWQKTTEKNLLTQEVEDEKFNLLQVIAAINGLSVTK